MPGAANATLPEASLDEGSSHMRALGADGGEHSILLDQKHLGPAHLHFSHPAFYVLMISF